ncbi:protein kinase [Mariniblastus sp.]|nr:protein kinase [Mariniblastus sp.]MDA7924222.1 protein kinase [Mariniblastus sp.]MDB4564459.1 protein kinase [Mariniblastus sp.]MDC3223933.1 protein kinase [Mariniblastus sp.]
MESRSEDEIQDVLNRYREAIDYDDADFLVNFVNLIETPDFKLIARIVALDIQLRRGPVTDSSPDNIRDFGDEFTILVERVLLSQTKFDTNASGDLTDAMQLDATNIDVSEDISFGSISGALKSANTPVRSPEMVIDHYRLIEPIGTGGMGTVWLAQQEEPVRRRVALKVTNNRFNSKKSNARFEAERQAIALMDHQNIAKILDAGTTFDGHPYFVMELVDGVPLNEYCDQRKLDLNKRLELMIPVCRAIQHAHQKGIIHRDLKHSNVLVTEYDGVPVPKVIDFGLAKSQVHELTLTDKTFFTEIGKVVGTIQYMSPEQAETTNVDVDTRSDIYSLGVMIYKLLVGVTPLDDGDLEKMPLLEALKIIREKNPSKPSAKVQSVSEYDAEALANRNCRADELTSQLSGDLDCIVMKALESDRKHRYQTANALAAELTRYLNNEKILARPHSTIYSLRKFVKRNRGLVASISSFVALLIIGIIATSMAYIWALNEGATARLAAEKSERASVALKKANSDLDNTQQSLRSRLLSVQLNLAWNHWKMGAATDAIDILNQLSQNGEGGWEVDYLWSEFNSSQTTLYGHADAVETSTVSRDGKWLATSGRDNCVYLWQVEGHKKICQFRTTETPSCLSFSADGARLACGDVDNKIYIWDLATQTIEKICGPYASDIGAMEFCPGTDLLLFGMNVKDTFKSNGRVFTLKEHSDKRLPYQFISLNDFKLVDALPVPAADEALFSFSYDGELLATAGIEGKIYIWKRENGKYRLDTTHDHSNAELTAMSLSPTGRLMTCGYSDQSVLVWELENDKLIKSFSGHNGAVRSVCFSENEELVLSGSDDNTAILWYLEGDRNRQFQGHLSSVTNAIFLPNRSEILTSSLDHTAKIWSFDKNSNTVSVDAHAYEESPQNSHVVWAADFSPDGNRLVSVSEDGTIAILDCKTGAIIKTMGDNLDVPAIGAAYAPDGSVIATANEDGMVSIWAAGDLSLQREFQAHEAAIWDLNFSPDSQHIITASADGSARIFDLETKSQIAILSDHEDEVSSASYSSDGSMIVTSSDDHSSKIWDAKTKKVIRTLAGSKSEIWQAVFSDQGHLVGASTYTGELWVWETATGNRILSVDEAHSGQIGSLAFSKDGTRLITAGDDASLRIWDIETGVNLFELLDGTNVEFGHVSFSDDGKKLVSGNQFGLITVRDSSNAGARGVEILSSANVELEVLKMLKVVQRKYLTESELNSMLETCMKYQATFPSFRTNLITGIIQLQLGNHEEAVQFLLESDRLEPLNYGYDDQDLAIEGWLALAYMLHGDFSEAEKHCAEFDERSEEFKNIEFLTSEIERLLSTQKPK